MIRLLDGLRDRIAYHRAYRDVAFSLSKLSRRELDDIGVSCVDSVAHDCAATAVAAARRDREMARTADRAPVAVNA